MVLKVTHLSSALYSKMSWAFSKTKEYSNYFIKETFKNCCPCLPRFYSSDPHTEIEGTYYTELSQLPTPPFKGTVVLDPLKKADKSLDEAGLLALKGVIDVHSQEKTDRLYKQEAEKRCKERRSAQDECLALQEYRQDS